MRVFQLYGLYPRYKVRLHSLQGVERRFEQLRRILLEDRFGASHLLKPGLEGDESAFLTAGNEEVMQCAWARENGVAKSASLDEIVLAQIEHHRAEVLYNLEPMRYGNDFLKRLPGCVRRTIAWRAAPSAGGAFDEHDLLLSNVQPMLDQYAASGMRTAYFSPAHDPELDVYAANDSRTVDVAFVGGYSRHHMRRAKIIESIASISNEYRVSLHLNETRAMRLAETPAGWIGPLRKLRRPPIVRAASLAPVFGRSLYTVLGNAKIVINGAIDMAGLDRANMRCWEAMGSRSLMLGEAGNYPPGMEAGKNFLSFERPDELPGLIKYALEAGEERKALAEAGYDMIRTRYSKAKQWARFEELAA